MVFEHFLITDPFAHTLTYTGRAVQLYRVVVAGFHWSKLFLCLPNCCDMTATTASAGRHWSSPQDSNYISLHLASLASAGHLDHRPAPYVSSGHLHYLIFNQSYFLRPLQEHLFAHKSALNTTYRLRWRFSFIWGWLNCGKFLFNSFGLLLFSIFFLREYINHFGPNKMCETSSTSWTVFNQTGIKNRFKRSTPLIDWSWLAYESHLALTRH